MKKGWLVSFLVLVMITVGIQAFAVDVKVSGDYYVTGMYVDNVKTTDADLSTAFFFQRLRVKTDFVISPCLKLVTRFDALERVWGGKRSDSSTVLAGDSAGTVAENENIAFDWLYFEYVSPIGLLGAGYMNSGSTGTIFGNYAKPAARIKYGLTIKDFTFQAKYTKAKDQSYSAVNPATVTDTDTDGLYFEATYKIGSLIPGLAFNYAHQAENRAVSDYHKILYTVTPFLSGKIGTVSILAEANWLSGSLKKFDNGIGDVAVTNYSAFLDVTVPISRFYIGGTVAYISGDDPATPQSEGGSLNGGHDWNPCLIMFNSDLSDWMGDLTGYDSSKVDGAMSNAYFGQGRFGVKPTDKADIMLSVSYATADKKPAGFSGGNYGTEIDLVGSYKLTDNLTYTLGAGYLFTGDYFKGKAASNKVTDDYILTNRITLTF